MSSSLFKLTSASLVFCLVFVSNISHAQEASVKAYVSLSPAGDFVAQMKKVTGNATLEGKKYSAKNIVVDMSSLSTGLELRDEHAKNKYLDIKKYPEAVLVTATGENGTGEGKLKYRNQEKPIKGTYKVLSGGKAIQADFKIKLSDYDIKGINYKGIGVDDEVKLEVIIPVKEAAAKPVAPPVKKK